MDENKELYKLFVLQCEDLLVLAEMGHNGMYFNSENALEYAKNLQEQVDDLVESFHRICGSCVINVGSDHHVSAVLFGGFIVEEHRVPNGVYKSGARKGEIRYARQDITHSFLRRVKPIENTETAWSEKRRDKGLSDKECQWSVSEEVLKTVRAKGEDKELIKIILEYRRLEKLINTYLMGWTNLIKDNCWEHNMIFGKLNQCVAVTGRLSSTQPNLQNPDKETKRFLESRYDIY